LTAVRQELYMVEHVSSFCYISKVLSYEIGGSHSGDERSGRLRYDATSISE